MKKENFFKSDDLPFAEARYSAGSTAPFKSHMHRTFSIGGIDTGEVLYTVEKRQASLKPGSLAVINPETLHSCNPVTKEGRSYFMLYLDINWCARVQQSLWDNDLFIPADAIRIDDWQLFHTYCRTMEKIMAPQVYLQEKEQMLFELASEVFTIACNPGAPLCKSAEDTELLRDLLQKDLQKDLPLNSLAQKLGANPYTLLRSFKNATGITPHAYRMNCRIDHAKELLRQGKDITETAFLTGFFDQSHLHRHFKAITATTPRMYRLNFVK
ncbi:helix-turn-helix transcriptional regulator [Desulfopila sp. IMCC35008]|uniref:AraC family transcriptional regulator n=1 Tax=Desulfopila sp. IMCC35008 TaxID=2653858 RepID=UPI0013D8680C|nr:helix-turn-helix transcriptional regulator [Desulfopila sp. IMCC35008]